MSPITFARRELALIPAFAIAAFISSALPAAAQAPMTININGNPVELNPPPIDRAGRVFVPLRGVFEQLGATVVYAGGVINATGRGRRTVSLRIGSLDATVNGQPATLDVAPFIIGASTYVPLRFISESLGAQVSYDPSAQAVYVNLAGRPAYVGRSDRVLPAREVSDVELNDMRPRDGARIYDAAPTIRADFSADIDPDTLRITLDGVDVTEQCTRTRHGFIYAPPSPLDRERHTVRVTGRDENGRRVDRQWSFVSTS